jgi:hypothetical protein
LGIACSVMSDSDLVPSSGDRMWLAQSLEVLARVSESRQGLGVSALLHPDCAELAFSDGNTALAFSGRRQVNSLKKGSSRIVEPAQIHQAIAEFGQRNRGHSRRTATGSCRFDRFESLPRFD